MNVQELLDLLCELEEQHGSDLLLAWVEHPSGEIIQREGVEVVIAADGTPEALQIG